MRVVHCLRFSIWHTASRHVFPSCAVQNRCCAASMILNNTNPKRKIQAKNTLTLLIYRLDYYLALICVGKVVLSTVREMKGKEIRLFIMSRIMIPIRLCSLPIHSPGICGIVFGERDLLAIFHIMNYDVKCATCLLKSDCRETTLSNAVNHFKIFLIEFEICLYQHPYFLYISHPPFPIAVLIPMLWQLKVDMFYPKK